jgi:serine kinase of HPr protein (carbohydrate metabolism regulator)
MFQYFLRDILQEFFANKKNGFFLHCSGVFIDKNAYLFLGQQGAGKSTIATMLNDVASLLADDSGIIVKEGSDFYFYQTPFIEKKQYLKTIEKFYIKKIFFIKKSAICCEKKILDKKEILDLLIKQLWTDKKRLNIQFKLLVDFVVSNFSQFYWLYFPKNKDIVIDWFIRFNNLF